jgi:hypothetical protein
MRFHNHYHEDPPPALRRLLERHDNEDHKTALWNAFIDSELTDATEYDCAILPRILPASYLSEIRKTALDLSTFAMRLLSLPEHEIRAIIPHGPIRDFLIDELEVLRHRNGRMIGSLRFDMAIVGEPVKGNPPKLLEINEIGFDGLARTPFMHEAIFSLIPELKKKVFALNTGRAEIRNMNRLGRKIARIQYDCYNWDEENLLRIAKSMKTDLRLISPTQFNAEIDKVDFPLLRHEKFSFANERIKVGNDFVPDGVQMSFAFGIKDYVRGRDLFRKIVRSKTPEYGPFITGLIASKMILVLFSDPGLRKRLLGSAKRLEHTVLPAFPLAERFNDVRENGDKYVIKHTDGFGGEQVFMEPDLTKWLHRIKPKHRAHWVVQERTRLNTLNMQGLMSRHKRMISDIGVFVQYDWSKGKFQNFEVGGFITRATNRSLKVNVSGGGIQVPVMFHRGK